MNKEQQNLEQSIHNAKIIDFVKTNPDYYSKEFLKIGDSAKYVFSFNFFALILGSMWFGARNIWNWSLAFLIIETFAIVQIIRGFFGNISADAYEKIDRIQSTIDFRQQQLKVAIENNTDKVEVFERTIKSLKDSIDGYVLEAQQIEESGIWIAILGIVLFVLYKVYPKYFCQYYFRKKIF